MHVAALIKRKGSQVIAAKPDAPITEVAGILARNRIGAVLVMDGDDRPVGILSERDIVRAVAAEGPDALSRPASHLMTRELVTCKPEDTVSQMMAVMTERRIRHVPVVEDGRVIGLVSIGDVVKARIDDAELEVESLRGYVGMS
ncbi:CBS domain-containing protein [Azospirillum sp. SYSU D00513]|uniref:CBS domain-containing protein n=1 Tax=Azospirillum sp. SYSU D00513 TaxID=2812561 RepID=UPI001A9736E7|nr:CBS domain-containing protein [Azospirillum sp. SYSU D00513]